MGWLPTRSAATRAEERLIQAAQAGSPAAFDALTMPLRPRLVRFLRHAGRGHAEAEDLAQDALLRAWQQLHRYRGPWRFSTWLFTIARRLAATEARRRRPTVLHLATAPEPVDRAAEPFRAASDGELHQRLWTVVERELNGAERQLLCLRYVENLTVAEIARISGRTRVGVRVALLRTRRKLAPHLASWATGETP